MRKIESLNEKPENINPEVFKREYELFCPYCNEEKFHDFKIEGEKGGLMCDKCKKPFGFTFGKVTQTTDFIGYMNVQGRLRIVVNNREETYNLNTDKKMKFKKADEIVILWKKGVFNEFRPKEVINYTNYFRVVI